jgi:hypothetical protein
LDKTIVTALLLIAGVISVVVMFNAIYPAITEGSSAMVGMERRIAERFRSQIEIVHVAPDGVTTKTALIWVKNIGATAVRPVESCDLFFGPEGNFARIPYQTGDSHWTYTIENDSTWKPTATIKITLDYAEFLADGERYYVKLVLPNGIADDLYFTK